MYYTGCFFSYYYYPRCRPRIHTHPLPIYNYCFCTTTKVPYTGHTTRTRSLPLSPSLTLSFLPFSPSHSISLYHHHQIEVLSFLAPGSSVLSLFSTPLHTSCVLFRHALLFFSFFFCLYLFSSLQSDWASHLIFGGSGARKGGQ